MIIIHNKTIKNRIDIKKYHLKYLWGFYNNHSEGFMLQGIFFFKVTNFHLVNLIFLRSLLICAHAQWFLIKYSKPHQFSIFFKSDG